MHQIWRGENVIMGDPSPRWTIVESLVCKRGSTMDVFWMDINWLWECVLQNENGIEKVA